MDGKYYSGRRLTVEMENLEATLHDVPAFEIARHLGRRIVGRVKRNLRRSG
jgi:hypothetical protein